MKSARLLSRLSRAQLSKLGLGAANVNKTALGTRTSPSMLIGEADRQASTYSKAVQSRAFAASALSDSPVTLTEAISEELEYERSTDGTGEASLGAIPQPPSGWTLSEEDGGSKLRLARQYEGEQIIVISDIVPEESKFPFGKDAPEDDLEEELAASSPQEVQDIEDGQENAGLGSELSIPFEVQIEKRGEKLRFQASFEEDYIDISHVAFGEDKEDVYDGPEYETLDPNLQQAFVNYLEERGVGTEFGEFLMAAQEAKEHKEYINWLSKVQKFLSRN